ncbi:hypothetical protein [Halobacterium sp. CBA1126]|uniref:hypothetical protein n=1 Tax=Halobacterium sp. CBA1126 TaxID=2668074 RepID=UPI0012F75780|nr:hypothetical protein [Halobacterium sp. CBA1126]MUV59958.1 hypothetical protein [Halobacterium sp. CBA1126]
MENRKDVTVPMPGAMVDEIDDRLEYGDSVPNGFARLSASASNARRMVREI